MKSKQRLLINAEAFGYGPTAAIATIFPYLRDHFEYIGYVGEGHTLDLQKNLPYDAIHDISGMEGNIQEHFVREISKEYDIFFTALDFRMAEICKGAELRVCIYDPLTWYWPEILPIIGRCDLYLAQDFFGVKERIERESRLFPETRIVPPIVSQKVEHRESKHVLVNLGGLQNPHWNLDDTVAYAKSVITAIQKVIPDSEKIVITSSNAIAAALAAIGVVSYPRSEMYKILHATKYAFMTPGLGNIYDVAKFSIPTIWLPPANDSQGQQLILLDREGFLDAAIDWKDIVEETVIDYSDPQLEVLEKINHASIQLRTHPDIGPVFEKRLSQSIQIINDKSTSTTDRLLTIFGVGGAEKIAKLIHEYALTQESL